MVKETIMRKQRITGSTLKVTAKENMLYPDELKLESTKTIAEIFNEEKETEDSQEKKQGQ